MWRNLRAMWKPGEALGALALTLCGCSNDAARTTVSAQQISSAKTVEDGDAPPTEHASLGQLLTVAQPPCVLKRGFFESDGSMVSSQSANAPSLSQAELEAAFEAAAKSRGLTVTERPMIGKGVFLESSERVAMIDDATVTILVPAADDWKAVLERSLGDAMLESFALVSSFGKQAVIRQVDVEHWLGGYVSASWRVHASEPTQAIEEWASKHGLKKDGDSWVKPHDESAAIPHSTVISIEQSGEVNILETRGKSPPACPTHPSREAASPGNSQSSDKEKDALMQDMMGR